MVTYLWRLCRSGERHTSKGLASMKSMVFVSFSPPSSPFFPEFLPLLGWYGSLMGMIFLRHGLYLSPLIQMSYKDNLACLRLDVIDIIANNHRIDSVKLTGCELISLEKLVIFISPYSFKGH